MEKQSGEEILLNSDAGVPRRAQFEQKFHVVQQGKKLASHVQSSGGLTKNRNLVNCKGNVCFVFIYSTYEQKSHV